MANNFAARIEDLELKLETITGIKNPNWIEIDEIAKSFEKLKEEQLEVIDEVKNKYPNSPNNSIGIKSKAIKPK